MNYFLVLAKRGKDYIALENDLKNIGIDFNGELKPIINFTTSFLDKDELKSFLVDKGIVSENYEGTFRIMKKDSKDKESVFLYEVPFEDSKFLLDPVNIKTLIYSRRDDLDYIQPIIEKYHVIYKRRAEKYNKPYFYLQSSNTGNLLSVLGNYSLYHSTSNNYIDRLNDFVNMELYKNKKLDYPKLIELAMTMKKQDDKINEKKMLFEEACAEFDSYHQIELEHFEIMLEESAITDEDRERYEEHVKKLKK